MADTMLAFYTTAPIGDLWWCPTCRGYVPTGHTHTPVWGWSYSCEHCYCLYADGANLTRKEPHRKCCKCSDERAESLVT